MRYCIVLLVLLLCACDYFEKKKVDTKTIVEQELQSINWKDVDEYPSFSVCDSVSGKQQRKICFETTILNHVNGYLAKQHIVITEDINDTVFMGLAIDRSGLISITEIEANTLTRELLPDLDSLLNGSISGLPKIFPAIKRRQQVNTEFILPINLVIE